MTDQHPTIVPPPSLMRQWREQAPRFPEGDAGREERLIERSAQWGYDQRSKVNEAELQQARDEELEACCEEIKSLPSPLGIPFGEMASNALRAARRPKPPSLKKQALEDFENLRADLANHGMGFKATNILRALEALPDD